MGSCMRNRVVEGFDVDSPRGTWRCKKCTYTCQGKKVMRMFNHLRTVHWKANGPASADEFAPGNRDAITGNGFETPKADEQETKNDVRNRFLQTNSNSVSNKIGEDEPRTLDDVRNGSGISSDNGSVAVDEESITNGCGNGHYKIMFNFPDGNEIEGFVVNGEDNLKNAEKENRAVNLNRDDVHDRPQFVFEEKDFPPNLQRDVEEGKDQELANDNVSDFLMGSVSDQSRKFDYWHSKKFGKKLDNTPLSRSNIRRNFTAMRTQRGAGQHVRRIKSDEPEPPEREIQVPMEDVRRVTTDIDCDENGQTSITYEYISMEKTGEKRNVAVITLNRPRVLNALCKKLMDELNDAVTKLDSDDGVGAIIITGSETAFAAGTDIKEMQDLTYSETIKGNVLVSWNGISKASKPVIAAVNGYALGGGCELAMMCDIIYAGEKAWFGQPEIVIGTIPGAGGSQRLTRVVGKSKAMEMVLAGKQISGLQAEKSGLVSKVFPPDQLLGEAIKLGERISAHSQLIVAMAKEAVNSAYETTLEAGLHFEKKLFCGTFATADQKEGMGAFIDHCVPEFTNE